MAASSHGATFDLTEVRLARLSDVHDRCTCLWPSTAADNAAKPASPHPSRMSPAQRNHLQVLQHNKSSQLQPACCTKACVLHM